jgi:hypothetical protein
METTLPFPKKDLKKGIPLQAVEALRVARV